MTVLILIAVGFLLLFSVVFRTIVFNPVKSAVNAVMDFYKYIRYKKWNVLYTGQLVCYCALFGRGKTLSVVHYVLGLYKRYNDKPIYDFDRKKWVTQKVHVISNVDLNIPFEKFVSLSQIVRVSESFAKKDLENDTLTCTLVLGDEFSVQMNSRNFKSNIDPLFLNTLLTCRHHHISIVYDAQRFNHVDALLRQVTSYVIQCKKVWRVMVSEQYDAWELENANSPSMIKPVRRYGWFIQNKDFEAYDTLACVDNLKRSCRSGDMLSEKEILELQSPAPANMDIVDKPSRKFNRNMRKRKKLL